PAAATARQPTPSALEAAVDAQRRGRDEGAVVAGQEEDRAGDLLGRGVARERDALLEELGRAVLGGAGGDDLDAVLEAVVDRPGMDAVDADAAVGHLARRGAHEPDDRVLGGRVAVDPRVSEQAD